VIHSALRETQEELGIKLDPKQLHHINIYQFDVLGERFINHEFVYLYASRVPHDVTMRIDDTEVGKAKRRSRKEFHQELQQEKSTIIPYHHYGPTYRDDVYHGVITMDKPISHS